MAGNFIFISVSSLIIRDIRQISIIFEKLVACVFFIEVKKCLGRGKHPSTDRLDNKSCYWSNWEYSM